MKLPAMTLGRCTDANLTSPDDFSAAIAKSHLSPDGVSPQNCGCDPGERCYGPCILGSCAGQCLPW